MYFNTSGCTHGVHVLRVGTSELGIVEHAIRPANLHCLTTRRRPILQTLKVLLRDKRWFSINSGTDILQTKLYCYLFCMGYHCLIVKHQATFWW